MDDLKHWTDKILNHPWNISARFQQVGFLFILLFLPYTANARSTVHKLGDWGQYALPCTALTISLAKKDSLGVLQFAKSTFVAMATIYALKYSLNTRRPNRGDYSFPSGHTGIAFTSAAYLERRYGLSYGLPAYIAAGFVGYSRIYARRHHTIDVLAAAGIAIAANYFFTTRFKKCQMTPVFCQDTVGIALNYDL